ncbi:hypothetical protein ACFW04_013064 [Cataglyphis niger]
MQYLSQLLRYPLSTFTSSVNIWNCRYWAEEDLRRNPHWLREIEHQHVWKVNVWCGIIEKYVGKKYWDFFLKRT